MIARTNQEIAILREGGRRLARHLQALSAMVKPGVAVSELEKEAVERLRRDGDESAFVGYPSGKNGEKFPGTLCVSINDTIVHSPAANSSAILKGGDVVCLDFGIKHEGLITDHAVTVVVGSYANRDDERLVRGTEEALKIGIAQAKVGHTTGHIGEAVEKVANKYHFGFPRNLGGHGVGKKIHEEPHISNFGKAGEGVPLVENMVIAIEPMMTLGSGELYVDKDSFSYRTKDGSRTAHFEHTILVTRHEPEILTQE